MLAESTSGRPRSDAGANRFLKTCDLEPTITEAVARRCRVLRAKAKRGSAVDAVVVALAEPGATVVTSDRADLEALAAHADRVQIVAV